MKKRRISVLCVLVLGMMFFSVSSALAAYTISMEATTDGSTIATEWPQGGYLYLTVTLTKALADLAPAGVAFTLNYDSALLSAPVTTADGDASVNGTISSGYPFMFQTVNKTHKANSSEGGKVYFSGAAINESVIPRGGPGNTNNEIDLFTARFQVNWTATINSPINFSIVQTQLWNPLAGYGLNNGNPVTEDRAFGSVAGDTKETVPVLVGAVDENDANFDTLALAFPVLLNTLPGTPVNVGPVIDNPNQPIYPGINTVVLGDGTGWTNSSDVLGSNAAYTGLSKWDASIQGWRSHSSFVSVPLSPGETFFLISNMGGGFPGGTQPSPSYTLYAGVNFIMLPASKAGLSTSTNLIADITAAGTGTCTGASRWDGQIQGWVSHSSFVPFNIAVGEVYLVIVTQDLLWP